MTQLTISILVHEDFTYIHQALASIIASTLSTCKIYVVINKGDADQITKLQVAFPNLDYIINIQPQGFASNHNMIMKRAETPYIALLNDDIAVHDSALDILLNYLANHPKVGIVAPQLQYEDGSPQVTVYSDPTLLRMIYKISGLGRFTHQKSRVRRLLLTLGLGRALGASSLKTYQTPQTVDVVKAAAIMVRRTMVDEVGLIDETTKAFGEEIDWNLRMRQQGWDVMIVPQARITHFGLGQALMQLRDWQIVEDRKAILNYYVKHRPQWQVFVIRSAIVGLHLMQAFFTLFVMPSQIRPHLQTVMLGLRWQRDTSST